MIEINNKTVLLAGINRVREVGQKAKNHNEQEEILFSDFLSSEIKKNNVKDEEVMNCFLEDQFKNEKEEQFLEKAENEELITDLIKNTEVIENSDKNVIENEIYGLSAIITKEQINTLNKKVEELKGIKSVVESESELNGNDEKEFFIKNVTSNSNGSKKIFIKNNKKNINENEIKSFLETENTDKKDIPVLKMKDDSLPIKNNLSDNLKSIIRSSKKNDAKIDTTVDRNSKEGSEKVKIDKQVPKFGSNNLKKETYVEVKQNSAIRGKENVLLDNKRIENIEKKETHSSSNETFVAKESIIKTENISKPKDLYLKQVEKMEIEDTVKLTETENEKDNIKEKGLNKKATVEKYNLTEKKFFDIERKENKEVYENKNLNQKNSKTKNAGEKINFDTDVAKKNETNKKDELVKEKNVIDSKETKSEVLSKIDMADSTIKETKNISTEKSVDVQGKIIEQLTEKIDYQRIKDKEVLKVKLDPEYLGEVEIKVEKTQEGYKINFNIENKETKQLIGNGLKELEGKLLQQGFENSEFTFSQSEERNQERQQRKFFSSQHTKYYTNDENEHKEKRIISDRKVDYYI